MAGKHFIPRADGAFDAWQANFLGYAASHAEQLGLSVGDVAKLQTFQKSWVKGFTVATAARDAWQSAVAVKDDARSEYAALIRTVATQLRARTSLTDAQRAALGLTMPNENAAPAGPPASAPQFTVNTSQRLRHSVAFFDSDSPSRRAKPAGTFGVDIRVALLAAGESAPADAPAYEFRGIYTRSPATIEFDGAAAGRTACYQLRWLNTRGQAGPVSALGAATVTA